MAKGLTADTSAAIPSLLLWHPLHEKAKKALQEVLRLPAHAMAESFSVLTRFPSAQSLRPAQAEQLLLRAFPEQLLCLSPSDYLNVIRRLVQADIGGGRIYDGLVGASAAQADFRLVTADRRALPVYALVGVEVEFVE